MIFFKVLTQSHHSFSLQRNIKQTSFLAERVSTRATVVEQAGYLPLRLPAGGCNPSNTQFSLLKMEEAAPDSLEGSFGF